MYWFWLNMPLAALFFGAWYGIPMRKILTCPDWSGKPATHSGGLVAAEVYPVAVPEYVGR
jgi:hypothetical protein